jgi:tRNA(fMet)-specific endonuclease VapC
MAVDYLLDTNIASYIIKGNVPRVRQRLLRHAASDIGVSVVTEAELRFGAERHPAAVRLRMAVDEFLAPLQVLAWDSSAALQYAKLRASLERSGTPVGNLDLMIAAHVLSLDAVLVTNDRVFRYVKGLTIEDWT